MHVHSALATFHCLSLLVLSLSDLLRKPNFSLQKKSAKIHYTSIFFEMWIIIKA